MFWLIENKDQLDKFITRDATRAFIEIIPFSYNIHPADNNYISLIYVRPLGYDGYIVAINHEETLNTLDISWLDRFDVLYVRDKKEVLHYIFHPNIIDLTLNRHNYQKPLTNTHNHFYSKYPYKKDLNTLIPVTKHFEYCENLYDDLKFNIDEPINDFYNRKSTVAFYALESNGIRICKDKFEKKFHSIHNDTIYTQYNFKTTTTRPSNKFRGVNYSALSKKDDSREAFIPCNDMFIEMDISAYHPSLLAKLIDYEFNEEDIHEAFAKMYGVEYKEAKQLTFKMLYSGNFGKYSELDFFKKAKQFTNIIWEEFNNNGFIECPVSKYKFEKTNLEDINPPKLLNYLLQNLETSNNVLILWRIFKILKNKQTKLVLYNYDSFLFDFHKSEKHLVDELKMLFKEFGLRIKLSYGTNYSSLQPL
jgi:hypothetical protein